MKRLREERGVGLREIAEATKISVGVLEALERNDVSRLPGGIFSRGLVRAYAEQIGADPEMAVRDFGARFPHDVADAESDGRADSAQRPYFHAARIALILAVLLAAAAAIGWWLYLRA